jgi:Mg2+ and Co2+ transporter CorA
MNKENKPPLFKNWTYWYAVVLGFLILLITLIYFFTKAFS